MRSTTFLLFFISLIVLAGLHILSLTFELYWTYLWLDIPMHVLGGATVAFGFLTLFPVHEQYGFRYGLLLVLLATLVLGVVWEAFEYTIGFTRISEVHVLRDTVLDTTMNLLGGALGFIVARYSSI